MDSSLQRRLRGLRTRLRGLYLVAGVARLVCEVVGYLVVAYLLDRFAVLPAAVRVTLLALACVAFVVRLWQLVLYPMKRRIRIEDMALAVERGNAELDGSLASAVEFSRQVDQPPADVSPDLLRSWLAQFEQRVSSFRFEQVFDLRVLRRFVLVALGLLLAVGAYSFFQRAEAQVFAERLLGSSREWPRRTHLRLDIPGDSVHYRVERDDNGHPRSVHIARGASLPVVVEVDGWVPDDVFLDIEETGRLGRSEEVRMLPDDENDERFTYRFRNLTRPLILRPTGGDDPGTRREVEIVVSAPPTVDDVVATMTPPPYTGQAPSREERQSFTAPVGTRLDLEFTTSGAVESGSVTRNSDPTTEVALAVDPENARRLLFTTMVVESGSINLHLVGESGFRNLVPLDYVITAIKDRRPTVEVRRPPVSSVQATEEAVIPFQVLARDDYGVSAVDLGLTLFGTQELAVVELLRTTSDASVGQGASGDPVDLFHSFDLRSFRYADADGRETSLVTGQSLSYRVRVLDNREASDRTPEPGEHLTPPRSIEIVSEGEKTRKLSDRQLRLKQKVQSLRKNQDLKVQGIRALLDGLASMDTTEVGRELQALEVDQARVRGKAGQVTRDFVDIVEEYVLNRLDHSATSDRVLEFWLDGMRDTPVRVRFDVEAHRKMLAAWKQNKFGQLDTLHNLFGMLDLALEASETYAEAATAELQTARVTGSTERQVEAMERAEQAGRRVVELYDELLEKMVDWESFQKIVEQMRGLVEDQEALFEAYRKAKSR